MSKIHKRFAGSGLGELIANAGIVTEKSADRTLKGKHYLHCFRAHKLMYEGLARRLIKNTLISEALSANVRSNFAQLVNVSSHHTHKKKCSDAILCDASFGNCVEAITGEVENSSSKMARYWMSYMRMVEILFLNYHALRSQNWLNIFYL